ncbi:hypothetical protein GRI39_01955 [Altererythrobacter indicus]|uniref:Uncharacterized protein n=1 Tax=Altericroceibacterium indicum TaxID=374177 RepID=A0A845A3Q2_9SPHN|nr:hypothetical protein [Altericroceibacterium indicum]MXP24810.1 hypothetical protein [Altericroceibacterium indicum]
MRARLDSRDPRPAFDIYYRHAEQMQEKAALIVTDRAASRAVREIRGRMRGAGLGRLGNAIGSTSDLKEGRGVYRRGAGFSASGALYLRTRSERTVGAISAYTEGADIRPKRGRWLWIATDQLPRVTGRERMTPELYRKNGFEQKIGPLVLIRSVNGNPLLVVPQAGVSEVGKRRSARSLKKNGQPRKGQRLRQNLVAFVGIPRTSRAARVDPEAIIRAVLQQLPANFHNELARLGAGRR